MGSTDADNLQEKLASMLDQLYLESGILQKMIYKNKNQHRRSSYFRYLLQVFIFFPFLMELIFLFLF